MQSPPAQLWQVILGHLASLERLVPHGRLRMRSLQWHLKSQWSPESDPPSLPVALPEEARRDLSWWMVRDHLLVGFDSGHLLRIYTCIRTRLRRLGCSPPRSKRVRGVVRPGDVVAHQSSRNEGPLPGSSGFSRRCSRSPCGRDVRQLHGCGVRQQTGGHGVEASVFVDQPPSEMDGVFRRPSRSEVSSRRVQRPGRCTQLSLASCGTEWSLHPQVARALLRTWGNPSIDLFATCLNAKLPLYCSLVPDPQAVFEDAFRHPWDDLDLYAFPPFALVGRVIARVQQSSRVAMTLVAPLWQRRSGSQTCCFY